MTEDFSKHHRRSIRLKGYDYSQEGGYFVTVDTWNHECIFGSIADGRMHLNGFGKIVGECWDLVPEHFPNVELDEFIIMPNHVHGIFIIMDDSVHMMESAGSTHSVGATHASPLQQSSRLHGPKSRSVGSIVGSFKSAAAKRINEIRGEPGARVWQRNYYEHVIRDEIEMNRIRQYIMDNPAKWESDKETEQEFGEMKS